MKDEPIASATATCDIIVATNQPLNTNFLSPGALVALTGDDGILLLAQAEKLTANSVGDGKEEYRITCSAASDGPWIGRPTGEVGNSKFLAIHVAKDILPVGSIILGGHVVWVINNEAAQKFEIPSQHTIECENGVASGFGVLLAPGNDFGSLHDINSLPNPDTLASPH